MRCPRCATFFALVALITTAIPMHAGVRWELIKWQIARTFPEVPTITTEELAAMLAHGQRPLLLDVRTRAEFEVSHLPGARHVEPKSDPNRVEVPARKDASIVTYCAVGYRSAEFARALRAAGFTNVRNLEGSIFQWANEDRPLEKRDGAATTVHPFDRVWGSLLKKERRANVASER
jgi:rhodanese-related sulfurtransferase